MFAQTSVKTKVRLFLNSEAEGEKTVHYNVVLLSIAPNHRLSRLISPSS